MNPKKPKPRFLIEPAPVDEMMDTAKGQISYLDWCKAEVVRIGTGKVVLWKDISYGIETCGIVRK